MKLTCSLALSVLFSIAGIPLANAHTTGVVLLDTAHTGQFDTNNVPLPGVLVVVTNTSGTFSNAMVTTSPEGAFSIQVGAPTDTYVEYLVPSTLPTGSTVELPPGGLYTFTLGPNNTNFVGNFLVNTAPNTTVPQAVGAVLQDVNGTGQFAPNNLPVPNVLVVVTNLSGTFSNAMPTTSPLGLYTIPLGSPTDTYVAYLLPETIPGGANVAQPPGKVYQFTLSPNNLLFHGNFLLSNLTNTPPTPQAVGVVLQDVNQSGQFAPNDIPLQNVLVVVTNTSGTFSNAVPTTAPLGLFTIPLPSLTDTYVEYLVPETLPSGANVAQPPGGLYTFTLSPISPVFHGNFLVSTLTNTPPSGNGEGVKGHGTILGTGRHAKITFTGSAFPSCGSTNGDTGEWDVVAKTLKLRFTGAVENIVNTGEGTDAAGNVFRFVEFEGAGVLKGIQGCKQNYGLVSFFGHAEDHGHSCTSPDSLYFRVDGANGTTLLLISGDASNPADIVPVPISSGDIQVLTNVCDHSGTCGNTGGEGDHGQGEHHGVGNGGNNGHHGQGDDNGQGDDHHGQGNCNGNQGEGNHGGGNGHGNSNHGGGNSQGNHGEGNGSHNQGNGNGQGNCNQGNQGKKGHG